MLGIALAVFAAFLLGLRAGIALGYRSARMALRDAGFRPGR